MDQIIKGRVAIIGAGVAGLSVATNLRKFGWQNVKIFEGRDRVGGRVYSKPYGDKTIEVGAQWIHGEEGNAIYEIAAKNDLVDQFTPSFTEVLVANVQTQIKKVSHREMFLEIYNDIKEIECRNTESFGRNFSDYIRKKLTTQTKEEDINMMKWIFDWVYRFECHIAGTSHLFHVSSNDNYKHCDGNPTVELKDNYTSVVNKLKENIPANWIELNHCVTLIDSTQPGQTKIVMENGKSIEADHIVVTLPLGVLKSKAHELFQPSLPNSKMSAIKKIGYGTVDKIYLHFETPFWDSKYPLFSVFWRDGKNHRGFSNEEAYSNNNEYFWTNFNHSGVEKVPWERCIIYFTYVRHQPNLLCAWISGEGAEVMERLPDSQVLEGCHSVLSYILPEKDVPRPSNIIRSGWFRDQFSAGSYSYDSILCDNPPQKIRADLANPVMSRDENGKLYPALLFAGEATHDQFFSTVHGAYETGLREAIRLKDYAESLKLGCQVCSKTSNVKIGVIGAGIAGLAACSKLKDLGFYNVTVFEGSDRIGGRINTVSHGDGVLEIGAQWVHGEEGNLVYEFSQNHNLLSDPRKDYSVEGKGHFVTSQSFSIDENLVEELIMALDTISENVVSRYEDVDQVKGISLGFKFREMFLDYFHSCLNDSDEVKLIKEGIYNWYCQFLIIDNCCNSLDDLSILGTNEWIDCPGVPLINFNSGFSSLVECLANDINFGEPKPTLVLNKGVSRVNWATGSGHVELSFEDESKELFSHVIVTSSIGYLKENLDKMFIPSLPHSKRNVINSIGYGTVNKFYLIFNEPFWEASDLGFQLVWLPNEPKIQFPAWVYGISGFDIVRGQSNVLVGWIGGEQACKIEVIDDVEVIDVCTSLLRHFIGRNDIHPPVSIIRSKWFSDPYIKGSYCHRLLGFESLDNPIEELCRPLFIRKSCNVTHNLEEINFPVVFFAGEATDKHYFSSVHGAMESGYREAQKIFNLYNVKQ